MPKTKSLSNLAHLHCIDKIKWVYIAVLDIIIVIILDFTL